MKRPRYEWLSSNTNKKADVLLLFHIANGVDRLQTLVSALSSINHSSAIFTVVKVAFRVFLLALFDFAIAVRVRTFH